MNIAAAQQDLASGYADHLAGGKQATQCTRGSGIPALVVERHDDALIGDVKIDIGGRQAIARPTRMAARAHIYPGRLAGGHIKRARLMDSVNGEVPPACVARRFQSLIRIIRNLVLRVLAIFGPSQRDVARTRETRELVDMPAGFVEMD